MKAAALVFAVAALSLALPTASRAATYDQQVGGVTTTAPQEQQAQMAPDRNHECDGLRQRAQELQKSEEQSRDHGGFAHARDQLDQINDRLKHDCGR